MSERSAGDEAAWLVLWNIGILVGLIGLPTVLGFFAGRSIELAHHAPAVPWRFLLAAVGLLVGLFAAWRTFAPRRASRSGD